MTGLPRDEAGGSAIGPSTTSCAELRLANGDVFVVQGALRDVERKLSDAARSGQNRLAWLDEQGTDTMIGVNPGHVVALRQPSG